MFKFKFDIDASFSSNFTPLVTNIPFPISLKSLNKHSEAPSWEDQVRFLQIFSNSRFLEVSLYKERLEIVEKSDKRTLMINPLAFLRETRLSDPFLLH